MMDLKNHTERLKSLLTFIKNIFFYCIVLSSSIVLYCNFCTAGQDLPAPFVNEITRNRIVLKLTFA